MANFNVFTNSTSNTVVTGTGGADSITNRGANVTIDGGDGNDTINSSSNYPSINGGKGNDYIKSTSYSATINEDDGNDTIYSSGSGNVLINGGKDNDFIFSVYSSSTINGGSGNDTINLTHHEDLILYVNGDGNDIISGFDISDTIKITNGTISSIGSNGKDVILKIGAGSITLKEAKDLPIHIKNADSTDTIAVFNGKSSVEVIGNNEDEASISDTAYSDYIFNEGWVSTIDGDSGNDYILAHNGYDLSINDGDGTDIVSVSGGYYRDITLELAAGTTISKYAINSKTNDHTFTIGKGSITFKNVAEVGYAGVQTGEINIPKISVKTAKSGGGYEYTKYVNGVAFNDNVSVDSSGYTEYLTKGTDKAYYINGDWFNGETIEGGVDDDYIDISGQDINIIGGAGKDTIFAGYINNSTIDGGTDNDVIEVQAAYYKGKDVIYYADEKYEDEGEWTFGRKVTINGGKDNDTIHNRFINMPNTYTKITNDDYRNETVTSYLDSKTNTYVTVTTWFTNGADESGTSTVTNTLIYDRTFIYADGDGNDSTVNNSSEGDVTINAGKGNHTPNLPIMPPKLKIFVCLLFSLIV